MDRLARDLFVHMFIQPGGITWVFTRRGKEQLPVKKGVSRSESELGRNYVELRNKSKEKRNRRKERKKNSCKNEIF